MKKRELWERYGVLQDRNRELKENLEHGISLNANLMKNVASQEVRIVDLEAKLAAETERADHNGQGMVNWKATAQFKDELIAELVTKDKTDG